MIHSLNYILIMWLHKKCVVCVAEKVQQNCSLCGSLNMFGELSFVADIMTDSIIFHCL